MGGQLFRFSFPNPRWHLRSLGLNVTMLLWGLFACLLLFTLNLFASICSSPSKLTKPRNRLWEDTPLPSSDSPLRTTALKHGYVHPLSFPLTSRYTLLKNHAVSQQVLHKPKSKPKSRTRIPCSMLSSVITLGRDPYQRNAQTK